MIRSIVCFATACIACGMTQASAEEFKFGDHTVTVTSLDDIRKTAPADVGITITPRRVSEPVVAEREQADSQPTEKPRAISVSVRVDGPSCAQPRSWYALDLPRVRSGASIYFPWKNYRRFVGFTSQYRPRTIYNYGR